MLSTINSLPLPNNAVIEAASDNAMERVTQEEELDPVQQYRITDGFNDVATTVHGERMRVQADGRKPFQFVYLRTESNQGKKRKGGSDTAATTITYDPANDRPEGMTMTKLPDPRELVRADETCRYLEVGIIIGGQPDKYTPTGQSRTKKKDAERAARGILVRDPTAMRVFIPETQSIASQAKLYVGVNPIDGYLLPRIIPSTHVFFYEEFWTGVEANASVNDQKTVILTAIRKHAARDKQEATQPGVINVTPPENFAAMLNMQWCAWEETRDMKYLALMLHSLSDGGRGLKFGPNTEDSGLYSFCQYDDTFSKVEAMYLVEEFELAEATDRENVALKMVAVHQDIRANGLGDSIPYQHLRFFLKLCNTYIPTSDSYGDNVHTIVEQSLTALTHYEKELPHRVVLDEGKQADQDKSALSGMLPNLLDALQGTEELRTPKGSDTVQMLTGILKDILGVNRHRANQQA